MHSGKPEASLLLYSLLFLSCICILLLFTRYQGVEPTNNAAERSLKHIVLWRKTSYGTQNEEGSHFIERAMSIWMTLKKQGKEALGFFQNAYLSTFNSEIQAPSI